MRETNPVTKYFQNPKRGRALINAMCATCVGCTSTLQGMGFIDSIEPGFRTDIRDCAVYSCPLHRHRPYQVKPA